MFLKLLSYPRSLIGVIIFIFLTAASAGSLVIVNILFNNRKIEDHIVEFWTRNSCRLFGVNVVVKGLENRPEGGFLYVFNHTSFFDIFAMNGWLGSFRFGAKIELFKIPVFGAGMRRAGILPIARSRREEVFKVYQAAEARIKAGERFALAPEGTRQEVESLGPFKSGPFVFAINAKAPIVPVIVKGAAAILPKGHYIPNWGVWKRTITLEVLPAVDTTPYTIDQRPLLQEKVRQIMAPYFHGDDF
ncbi:lysophospholipid acyltransferase family protein [Bdellovibrio svalbardensis]|uniref:1-acyl-sn-glycerol-3-phosphate acyltransferase n=1 Tax=Bdellovibrio svalbardensis TaxID=2972972 RepID=A0ABT6DQL7_9BACT|nr:lysophospholipid acyltransferase family protein [Bdellovibrio svalbardensis]MDG0818209.1 1-acyl-sn-glycerol-3-phosphate acyltransferase [Bdellovibrio svalbardensis]